MGVWMILGLSASARAGCDAAAVDALAASLAAATPSSRLGLAAAGWPALCAGDGVLDQQLAQIPGASADGRWLVELQASMLDARRWVDACTGGTLALSMATKLHVAKRRAYVWDKCALERYGAFERDEWEDSPGLLVLPVMAAHTLSAGGIPPERARPIVRALAEL